MLQLPESFEDFQIGLFGGVAEKRYRRMRPEVTKLPWGTLRLEDHQEKHILRARKVWTTAAFQEYRTGVMCSAALTAMMEVGTPLDIIAVATRFPLDEMVHVELCCRLLAELGGPVRLVHEPDKLTMPVSDPPTAFLRAAELVMRIFCVGEAASIPILHSGWKNSKIPLIRAMMGRIVKDEAAHGTFGWLFFDWIGDELSDEERAYLRKVARHEIGKLERLWSRYSGDDVENLDMGTLGWMDPKTYWKTAHNSLQRQVIEPLTLRGLDPRLVSPIAGH